MAKHKLARFEENRTFTNLMQVSYESLQHDGFEWKGRWADYFGNDHPVVLELGCGKGDYTVALAQADRQNNYIGIDIRGARLWRGAKTAFEDKMDNVAFIRTRIELIENFFSTDEVSEIWITFPDPQPKKPMKRLTSPRFIERYKHIMRSGGAIHLKTDSQELHKYTIEEVVEPLGYTIEAATTDLYSSGQGGMAAAVQTFYEKGYLAEGRKITYLKFRVN